MEKKDGDNLNNYVIERCFSDNKRIKDIIEEMVLSKNFTEEMLTDNQRWMYNNNTSM